MNQLNIHMDPVTEENLLRLMRLRRIKTKSGAVRTAIAEAADRAAREGTPVNYSEWLGIGRSAELNPQPRFASHDDLWTDS